MHLAIKAYFNDVPRHRVASGFTLVELLVVMLIVVMLVAVLLPALSEARAAAKRVMCASQLRQWSVAHNVYTHDWDGALIHRRNVIDAPHYASHRYGDQMDDSMAPVFQEYIGDNRLLICPDSWHQTGEFDHTPRGDRWRLGYAYLGYLRPISQPSPQARQADHILESDVKTGGANRPLVLMADVSAYDETFLFPVPRMANHPDRGGTVGPSGRTSGRGINVLYMAGHAKWIPFDDLDPARFIVTYNHIEHYWARQ